MNGRPGLYACLGVGGLVILFWMSRIVLPGRDPSFQILDLIYYFYPVYETRYASLASGVIPAWTPYELAGLPSLAAPAAGLFYPPHLLYLLLPTHLALAASGLLHLVFAALTTLWLLRRNGATAAAAALGGVVFALRGSLPQQLFVNPAGLEAAAWLPLGCIGVLELADRAHERARWLAALSLLAVASAASWLAGFPQTTIYVTYAWGALLLAVLVGERAPLRHWMGASARFAGGLAIGTLVAAVQILPVLELTTVGTRTAEPLGAAQMYSLGYDGWTFLRNALAGDRSSFSVVALALAPAALLWTGRRSMAIWALVVGGLAFAFALGRLTPLIDLLLELPALSWFRTPSRALLLASFSSAVLAALGLSVLARTAGASPTVAGRTKWAAIAVTGSTALAITGVAAWNGWTLSCAIAATTALLVLSSPWWAPSTQPAGVGALMLGLAALELFLAPANRIELPYSAEFAALYRGLDPQLEELSRLAGHDRVWLLQPLPLAAIPKLAPLHGIRSFTSKVGLNLKRQAGYYTYLAHGRSKSASGLFLGDIPMRSWSAENPSPGTRRRLADLAAVRYVVIASRQSQTRAVRDFVDEANLVMHDEQGPLQIYENPHALPRAFVTYRTRPAPEEPELLKRLSRRGFDPLATSFIEGDPGFVAGDSAPERGHAVTFLRDERHLVELEAELAAPGLVVLADTHYPGWRASVDGEPARILPTNHLFRGVPVAAGHHVVRFEYRPTSVIAGGGASIAGLVVLALLIGRWSRERARARAD